MVMLMMMKTTTSVMDIYSLEKYFIYITTFCWLRSVIQFKFHIKIYILYRLMNGNSQNFEVTSTISVTVGLFFCCCCRCWCQRIQLKIISFSKRFSSAKHITNKMNKWNTKCSKFSICFAYMRAAERLWMVCNFCWGNNHLPTFIFHIIKRKVLIRSF